MLVGLLARQVTPSSWGSAARKGFAKTLFSLTAFKALQATRISGMVAMEPSGARHIEMVHGDGYSEALHHSGRCTCGASQSCSMPL